MPVSLPFHHPLRPATGLALLLGLLLLSGTGCGPTTAASANNTESEKTSGQPSGLDRVTAGHPERKPLKLSSTQPGRIAAYETTPLHAKVTGYVKEILVDIGDVVEHEQTLIRLWIPEMQDELAQKEALVAQAEAEVKQAQAAILSSQAAVDSARSRVTQAEAGIGRAEGEYQRWKAEHARISELADNGSVTKKLVDETLNQFRAADASRNEAAANVESAKATLKETEAKVARADADLGAAEAQQRVAEANLQQTKTLVNYAEIKAPFAGVITQRGVDTGHYVHPANTSSSKPLLTVSRTDKVRVLVDIPELEASLVDAGEMGDDAVIRVQSLRDGEFKRKVTRTSWSLDPTNRSLRVEIDLPNENELLRPGKYASVTIDLDQRENTLVLPITAIVREDRKTFCCCVESGVIKRKEIELGLRSGNEVEVLSGIDLNDTIVLTRADSLQEGQQVELIQAKK